MRLISLFLIVVATLLSGCATNLQAVRGFAAETKKISVAFDPMLNATVARCQANVLQKRIFSSQRAVNFNADEVEKLTNTTCHPIEESNVKAKEISGALGSYAEKLAEIAGDGVAASVDDDFESLSKKLSEFPDIPKEKVGAVSALAKFLTQAIVRREQTQAIEEALSHESAVGALGDALVTYSKRVYLQYDKEYLKAIEEYEKDLSSSGSGMPAILSRQLLWKFHLDKQSSKSVLNSADSFAASVTQMKAALQDLRLNVNNLSDKERFTAVQKLVKEVHALYKSLNQAF